MSVTNTHTAIPKNIATNDDLDFHYLRGLGVQYIEELGGSLWTDFNSHDPGITMLEMLCYAITDLGMRIDLPINNLLASENKGEQLSNQFYSASEVFPTKPVIPEDYRKLFIDLDGVRNCWLRIAERSVYADCKNDILSYDEFAFPDTPEAFQKNYNLKGLYTLLVDFEGIDESLTTEERDIEIDKIRDLILAKYHQNRNLCEDLIEIKEVPEQPISVCASVEVMTEADEELIHAKILTAINDYFSTTLRFYSIKEMLDKGYSPDQIFDGPFLLDNGFIDSKELKEADLRSEVRLSDILKIIMNIEGVLHVKDISIGHCDPNKELLNEWVICIEEDTKPVLCDKSTFSYNKGVLPLNINKKQVDIYFAQLKEDALIENLIPEDERDLDFPGSTFLSPESYTTLQNDFPETYGIGQTGIAARATDERKAQVKQLKGYLLFFDKILASYFKHLGKVRQLLSINGGLEKTYFTQAIEDLKGFDELVKDYPTTGSDTDNTILTETLFGQQDNNIARRNEILDHLLARFAEKFGDYTFLMKALFGTATNEIVLANKEDFLNDYIAISSERGSAFNYYKQPKENLWNTDNISGVQKRIARLVGIKEYNRRTLSESFVDIYSLVNEASKTVFRWRIKDENKKIILSATEAYNTTSAASQELYLAVLHIIQTSEKDVENAFKNENIDDVIIGNIRVHKSNSGKYSFDIINLEKAVSNKDYIIAKQFKYYDSVIEVKEAILNIISFMKFKFTEERIFLVEHILLRPEYPQNIAIPEDTEVEEEVEIPEEVEVEEEVEVPEVSEHHFLPICTDNCEDNCGIDPYSYRVSIVIPGYTYRFSNPDFRNYMENIIKEELPAHILPKICWVGHRENDLENIKEQYLQQLENEKNTALEQLDEQITAIQDGELTQEEKDIQIAILESQKDEVSLLIEKRISDYLESVENQTNDLVEFEDAYQAYLFAKTSLGQEQPDELKNLLTAIGNLNTIYPVGRLLDCDDESDELEGKIILGQTNIGTL